MPSRRFRHWPNPDVLVLGVTVLAVLKLAPGHGVVGWVVASALAALVGAVIGVLGRRYPAIYGSRRRR